MMRKPLIKGKDDDGKPHMCKCGKPAKYQYDNGLPVGWMCDECFETMVAECRSRSW